MAQTSDRNAGTAAAPVAHQMTGHRRRLVLHIGQTGVENAAILKYLNDGYDNLLHAGFLFPRTGRGGTGPFDPKYTADHSDLLHDFQKGRMDALAAELSAHADTDVILSAKEILVDLSDDALQRLGAYFRDWQIDIVAIVHPQFDWIRARYIANVLKPCHGHAGTFHRFVRNALECGALDYHAALARIDRLLDPDSIRVIPVDEQNNEPVVKRFAQTVGIAAADPDAAKPALAGSRNESPLLVHAVARLNGMTRALPDPVKLELAHRMRRAVPACKTSAADVAAAFRVHISAADLTRLRDGNRNIVTSGWSKGPKTPNLGDTGYGEGTPLCEHDIMAIFTQGVRIATDLAAHYPKAAPSILALDDDQITVLSDTFAACPVSLHIGTPDTAVWAASGAGRLVTLLLISRPVAYGDAAAYDLLDTASPITASPMQPDDLPNHLAHISTRKPDVISVGRDIRAQGVTALLNGMQPRALILWNPSAGLLHDLAQTDYGMRTLDDFTIFSRADLS